MSAQQRLSFCFMPPDSLPAGRASNFSRLVAVRSSVILERRSVADNPNNRPKKSMFSKTESVG